LDMLESYDVSISVHDQCEMSFLFQTTAATVTTSVVI